MAAVKNIVREGCLTSLRCKTTDIDTNSKHMKETRNTSLLNGLLENNLITDRAISIIPAKPIKAKGILRIPVFR
jgi:hypothetical protein